MARYTSKPAPRVAVGNPASIRTHVLGHCLTSVFQPRLFEILCQRQISPGRSLHGLLRARGLDPKRLRTSNKAATPGVEETREMGVQESDQSLASTALRRIDPHPAFTPELSIVRTFPAHDMKITHCSSPESHLAFLSKSMDVLHDRAGRPAI